MARHTAAVVGMIVLALGVADIVAAQEIRPYIVKDDERANRPEQRASPWPERPASAAGGREFIHRIKHASLDDREAAILREITAGNFPPFLRKLKTISIRGTVRVGGQEQSIAASLQVMPDYLAVGGDEDFVRMPMTPQTAQRIANHFGCVLPTRKMVDAIDRAAELRIPPHPMTENRETVETFLEHHQIIEKQRADKPRGVLVVGIKKDIVLSPRIFERPNRLAIYGWRKLDGRPIQPLTIVHSDRYVDYSHGVRLVRDEITLDGQTMTISELLADPDLCALVSDEGKMHPPHYPLN